MNDYTGSIKNTQQNEEGIKYAKGSALNVCVQKVTCLECQLFDDHFQIQASPSKCARIIGIPSM